jgi:hypothetical protein
MTLPMLAEALVKIRQEEHRREAEQERLIRLARKVTVRLRRHRTDENAADSKRLRFAQFFNTSGSARRPRSAARALPGLVLATLLGALDQTIMAPALPSIANDLGGLGEMPVVVNAYLVAATVVMPVYGKLGDRFGRRSWGSRPARPV